MSQGSVLEQAQRVSRSALRLVHAEGERFSRIGGLPAVPPDFQWPEWNGAPLSFLAQFDLEEVASKLQVPWLAHAGQLYFFYDKDQSTWGFDPADRGSWRVIHATVERSVLQSAGAPPQLADGVFEATGLAFEPIDSLPDWQRIGAARGTAQEEIERLCAERDAMFRQQPKHQLFGYPVPLQDDSMELGCQLAANGIYVGDPEGYQTARARELAAGAADWRLLLQLDSDEAVGMTWGDLGTLYFWVREAEAQTGDFGNVWMILQCG